MDRRSFLRDLLALPCSVGLLARSLALQAGEAGSIPAPSTTPPSLLDYADAHPSVPAVVESTPWASGSDQTSIWFIDWQDNHRKFMAEHHRIISDYIRAAEDDKFIAKFTEQLKSGEI